MTIPDLKKSRVLNMDKATGQKTPANSPRVLVDVRLVSGLMASFLLKLRLRAHTSRSEEPLVILALLSEFGRRGLLSPVAVSIFRSCDKSPLIEYECDITPWPSDPLNTS